MRDPVTREEWQDIVDAAHTMLTMDDLIRWGLATGPDVNRGRCEELLRRGREQGIEPREDAIERVIGSLEPGRPVLTDAVREDIADEAAAKRREDV